jgi:environmental stress-induced protein Ves
MSVRVIRSGDLVPVAWKNGGGTTAEVAAFPEGSDFDTFGWRISMADVASDGPFSVFPGIDRTLIVLKGNGIELDVDGVPYRLNGPFSKLSFVGDDATYGRLLSGPIRDLNVMTRRGRFTHRTRTMGSGVTLLSEGVCAAFIVGLEAPLDISIENGLHSLQALDTLALDPTQELIQLSGAGRAILIEIVPELSAGESDLHP